MKCLDLLELRGNDEFTFVLLEPLFCSKFPDDGKTDAEEFFCHGCQISNTVLFKSL